MKQIILFLTLLFSVTAFAQENLEGADILDPSFNALTTFFLPALLGALATLFTDSVKHIKDGTWDAGIFAKTKILPLALSLVIGIAIYYMMSYAPYLKPYLEVLAGAEMAEITAFAMLGTAAAIIDGLLKKGDKEDGEVIT